MFLHWIYERRSAEKCGENELDKPFGMAFDQEKLCGAWRTGEFLVVKSMQKIVFLWIYAFNGITIVTFPMLNDWDSGVALKKPFAFGMAFGR